MVIVKSVLVKSVGVDKVRMIVVNELLFVLLIEAVWLVPDEFST